MPEMTLLIAGLEQETRAAPRDRTATSTGSGFSTIGGSTQPDDRRHSISGHGFVVGQAPERRTRSRRQADLFFAPRAARRRPHQRSLGLDATAGKADLSWMVGQVGAALGKQHRQAVGRLTSGTRTGHAGVVMRHRGPVRRPPSERLVPTSRRRSSSRSLPQPCLLLGRR